MLKNIIILLCSILLVGCSNITVNEYYEQEKEKLNNLATYIMENKINDDFYLYRISSGDILSLEEIQLKQYMNDINIVGLVNLSKGFYSFQIEGVDEQLLFSTKQIKEYYDHKYKRLHLTGNWYIEYFN